MANADVLSDFLEQQFSENSAAGPGHPKRLKLREIRDQVNRDKALELALQYMCELHIDYKKQEQQRAIYLAQIEDYHVFSVTSSASTISEETTALLSDMLKNKQIMSLEINDREYLVKIKADSASNLSKILMQKYIVRLVTTAYKNSPEKVIPKQNK
jgi:hypothetical protein